MAVNVWVHRWIRVVGLGPSVQLPRPPAAHSGLGSGVSAFGSPSSSLSTAGLLRETARRIGKGRSPRLKGTETPIKSSGPAGFCRSEELPCGFSSPELVLQGGDLSVHGLGGLRGVVQLALQLSLGGLGSLSFVLGLLQLTLQLLHSHVQLVTLKRCMKC